MLTCYGHSVRLPQNDLAYLAFRLALQETLSDIELHLDLHEEPDPPVGYLTEVPFLEQVPLPVQADLLADTWARHHQPELTEASLLDAAVVYAACMTAGRVINDMPDVAVTMLRNGPCKVDPRIVRRASVRLDEFPLVPSVRPQVTRSTLGRDAQREDSAGLRRPTSRLPLVRR